nr:hypothetical protein [uncultured Mediterranean phage uvMED]
MAQRFLSDIKLGDSIYIRLGDATNGDLQVLHDGTNSIISNQTGDLQIINHSDDKDIVFYSDDGSGNITEYFRLDGGNEANLFSKNVKLSDSVELRIGDSNDLKIYHSGTHSYIDNNTGNLYIRNFSDDKNIHLQSDDGSGGMTDYIVVHGSENIVKFQEHTRHLDNKQARFGTGSDLKIYHNGTDSYIQNATGTLQIQNQSDDKDILLRSDDGSGGVATYFYLDGSTVLNRFPVHARWDDSIEAQFGAGGDLKIYHDGNNSWIRDVNTGNLYIDTNGDFIALVSDGSFSNGKMGLFYKDGAVKLYYDNSLKIETTSAGATVTGALTVTGDLIVNGTTTTINTATVEVEDNILQLNTTQGSPDTATAATSGISIYRGDGVTQASFIFDDGDDTWDLTNNLKINAISTSDTALDINGRIKALGNGTLKWGSSANFGNLTWDTGYALVGGLSGKGLKLFTNGGSNVALTIDTSQNATFAGDVTISSATPELFFIDTDNNVDAKFLTNNGNLGIFADTNDEHSSSTIYFNIDGSEKARFTSGGKLGIGTGSSLDEKLHVQGSVNNGDIAIKIENTFDDNGASSAPASALLFAAASNNGYIRLTGSPSDDATQHKFEIGSTAIGSFITFKPSNSTALTLDSSQNATFAGDVRINGNDLEFNGAAAKISATSGGQISLNYNTTSNQSLIWYGGGTSEQFKVTNAGVATFAGEGTFSGGIVNVNGTTTSALAINAETHNTNVANVATLSFSYGHSGGTGVGDIKLTEDANNSFGADMTFGVPHNNGSGGSTTRTALTLDGGNLGATFAGNINFGDSHFIGDDADDNLLIQGSASENVIVRSEDGLYFRTGGNNTRLTINSSGNATFAGDVTLSNASTPQLRVTDTTNSVISKIMSDNTTGFVGTHSDHNFSILRNNSVQATFTSTGLGIATTSPAYKLHAVGSGSVASFGDGTRAFRIFTDSDEVSLLADGSVDMKFYTSGSEKMRLDSSGRLFVGHTSTLLSSSEKFSVSAGTNGINVFRNSSTGNGTLYLSNTNTSTTDWQTYLILQDGTGNRGQMGIFYNTSTLGISGQGGIELKTGATSLAGGTTALTIDTSQNATFAGDVTVEGGHQKILVGAYSNYAQTTDRLYIGGDGLASQDAAIYIGNRGNGTGYGYRIYYEGTGSGNNNKLIFKSENLGSNVDMLSFTADGNSTFAGDVNVGNLRIVGDNDSADQGKAFIRSNGDYLVLNPADGEHVYLNWDGANGGSGDVYVRSNIYAEALYDRVDTSYYADLGNTGTSLNVAGAIQLVDSKAIVWAGNNILSHNGTQTYIGDNASSSTVTITGGNTTFAGDITTNGDIIIDNSSGDPFLKLKTSAQEWVVRIDQSDSEKFQIRNVTGTDTALSIDTSSNATFTGTILSSYTGTSRHELRNATSNGEVLRLITTGDNRQLQLQSDHIFSNGAFYLGSNSYSTNFRGSSYDFANGNATFAGNVIISGEAQLVSNLTTDNTVIYENDNGTRWQWGSKALTATNKFGGRYHSGSGWSGLLWSINSSGNVSIAGALSKGSGSFKIDHPIESKKYTHHLVHSFVEAPQADNIYRGKVDLVDGKAEINIDTAAGMTEGTFVLLNTNVQCFTTNESNWDLVKGNVVGNKLTIESKNASSTASISWMVVGERQDQHMKDTDWTDSNGKVIVEPKKTQYNPDGSLK